MASIKNLNELLASMNPELREEEFVFVTVSKVGNFDAILTFKEKEGITLIIDKKIADKNNISYDSVWKMIALTVHSDLQSIGFLAKISEKMADSGISLNVVSAYYHDHLFVPVDKADRAMKLLNEFKK